MKEQPQGHRFAPGHPKYGGRQKGTPNKRSQSVRELITALEGELRHPVDPLEGLLRLGANPKLSLELRISCMQSVLPFVYPRLQSTALTNGTGGPLELEVTARKAQDEFLERIMRDPELRCEAEAMAIRLAQRGIMPQLQAPVADGEEVTPGE